MYEWILVDKFISNEGVKIIELKCPHPRIQRDSYFGSRRSSNLLCLR